MKDKKAIIFDLDGVIVDTAKYHFQAWSQLADTLGISFTKKDNERLKGVSRVQSLEIILSLGNKTLSTGEKQRLLDIKNNTYLQLIADMDASELLPGIKDLLDDLYASKVPFALGSASKNARKILNALQITGMFSAIVDGTDVNKAKPDPEVFKIAADKLGFDYNNCVVVEDAQAGIQAANAIGMTSIGIGDKEVLREADIVLKDTGLLSKEILLS